MRVRKCHELDSFDKAFHTRRNIEGMGDPWSLGNLRMRNKIPCSADRLSLLDPPMIQGVVDRNGGSFGAGFDRIRGCFGRRGICGRLRAVCVSSKPMRRKSPPP